MFVFLAFLFMSMFVYVNALYYSVSLLVVMLCLLFYLATNLLLSTLTMVMLCIVYIGAMMILIGYICAICPNLVLLPVLITPTVYSLVLMGFFMVVPVFSSVSLSSFPTPLPEYFYTYSGALVFFSLVFMLFLTLLMVTSQYMTPKGPFRSVII